jgi:hypothetical protein
MESGLLAGCLVALATCAGLIHAAEPGGSAVPAHTTVFTRPPQHVPTNMMPDGPLLGNGDVGVVLAGPPEEQRFFIGKNDFWRRNDASVIAVGSVGLSIPALQGASYRQEMDLGRAEVRGSFARENTTITTRSWVDANANLLLTAVRCEGRTPVQVTVRLFSGAQAAVPAKLADTDKHLNIGREQHGGGRWYFDGLLDDVRLYAGALPPEDIHRLVAGEAVTPAPVFSWPANAPPEARVTGGVAAEGKTGKTIRFDGRQTHVDVAVPRMDKAVTVAAWVQAGSAAGEANYIVSKGEWNQGYSLGLSNGRLRWSVGGTYVQLEQPLPLRTWTHIAATFDGRRMCVYVDGVLKGGLGGSGGGAVDDRSAVCSFSRNADAIQGSRAVAVATRILGADVRVDEQAGLQATLKPGETVIVASAVLSDLDEKDPLAATKSRVAGLQVADSEALAARHQAWWLQFWSRSFIEIPDKEIEKRWYAAQYVMGSCSRASKVAPGLWGNWITTDRPAWHGDFHLNYNFQAPYYIVYSSNHADLSLPFYQALLEAVPKGREIAKKNGWKGIHLPVSIGPWGLLPEGPDSHWGQRSDAAFAALNFIWQYQYTQDAAFLKDTAYPFLREVADFWEDYLKFEDGRYVIYNDSIHEGSGKDVNPLLSLGLVRILFANLPQMSADLGVDADRRAKWKDIVDRLSAFPLQERNGKTVFRYSEKGTAWWNDNTLGIHHIFPAGAIGLDSDPKLLEVCHNTIAAMSRWHDNNGFSSWYTACARVVYDPKTILAKLRTECDQRSYPSLVLYYGGGGIENVAGFLAVNEMLMQSHDSVIRLFPCWPTDLDARFGTLRARGAFVVSAELRGGTIGGVRIVSEKAKDCTVRNPWPGKRVALIRGGQAAETVAGDRFTFRTGFNETIELKPVVGNP